MVMGEALFPYTAGAFVQVKGPGPVRFIHAGGGRPDGFRDVLERVIDGQGRAGATVIYERFELVDVG